MNVACRSELGKRMVWGRTASRLGKPRFGRAIARATGAWPRFEVFFPRLFSEDAEPMSQAA